MFLFSLDHPVLCQNFSHEATISSTWLCSVWAATFVIFIDFTTFKTHLPATPGLYSQEHLPSVKEFVLPPHAAPVHILHWSSILSASPPEETHPHSILCSSKLDGALWYHLNIWANLPEFHVDCSRALTHSLLSSFLPHAQGCH